MVGLTSAICKANDVAQICLILTLAESIWAHSMRTQKVVIWRHFPHTHGPLIQAQHGVLKSWRSNSVSASEFCGLLFPAAKCTAGPVLQGFPGCSRIPKKDMSIVRRNRISLLSAVLLCTYKSRSRRPLLLVKVISFPRNSSISLMSTLNCFHVFAAFR